MILKTESLSKHFGSFIAVNNLNLEVFENDIYGFLGLNGAGKTTTLRLLLGLISPSGGRIQVFGQAFRSHYLTIMQQVGALVEIPAFYSYLSAYENLNLLARLSGTIKKEELDDLLSRVGLATRAHDKVRAYSQGMRQRLGIAQALLPVIMNPASMPKLVMLDEPTNGLDPQGIVEIRQLIKEFHETQHVTFIISSHLLTEIESLCNRVGIIKQGQLVAQGAINELLQGSAVPYARLQVNPLAQAQSLIKQLPWVSDSQIMADNVLEIKCAVERLAELNAYLVGHNIQVSQLTPRQPDLEEYFMSKMR
jgi:ABC-type multidrug transport system ATPase subunit